MANPIRAIVDNYLSRFRDQAIHLFGDSSSNDYAFALKKLDDSILKRQDSMLNLGRRPFLAFAYLHPGCLSYSIGTVELDQCEDLSQVMSFAKKVDTSFREGGLIRDAIRELPAQRGITPRKYEDFFVAAETFSPSPSEETRRRIYSFPIISLVLLSASDKYPHNKKANSKRAMDDLCNLGARVLNAGFNCSPESLVPFWVNSDFQFVNEVGRISASTERARIGNLYFLEKVFSHLS